MDDKTTDDKQNDIQIHLRLALRLALSGGRMPKGLGPNKKKMLIKLKLPVSWYHRLTALRMKCRGQSKLVLENSNSISSRVEAVS